MIETLLNAWQQVTTLEIVSVAFGLAYVVLAAKENIWCWPAAFIGTGTGIMVFWDASLLMESALNVFYLLMAVYGFHQWKYGGQQGHPLSITSWGMPQHLKAISLVTALAVASGYLLNNHTTAALPYVDSFTTWAAVVSTWMVARKILENWLYWVVIDAVSVWLFVQRELYLYALLFVLYTIIAVYGYLQWRMRARAAV
jgi:nicotinamide mononucleotide transporter